MALLELGEVGEESSMWVYSGDWDWAGLESSPSTKKSEHWPIVEVRRGGTGH